MNLADQTNAMTSCCSIANLTLESGAPGADGKRMWARLSNLNQTSRWGSWGGALVDAGCSAGLEGQDARGSSAGVLNWFNVSVCGPNALCMPHNPVAENKTRWAFTCKCTYGSHVDPTSTGDGIWFPNTHCTTRNHKGWVVVITLALMAIFDFCNLIYTCDTLRRLMKRSSKGCWATKLTFELIGLIICCALMTTTFSLAVVECILEDQGINKRQIQKVAAYFYSFMLPLLAINTLFVAVTWVHVASNARAFRRTTSVSARRRARIFVGTMCSFQVIICVFGWLTDVTFVALGTVFLTIVVLLTYLVGSCKVSELIAALGPRTAICFISVLSLSLFLTHSIWNSPLSSLLHSTLAAGRNRGADGREQPRQWR